MKKKNRFLVFETPRLSLYRFHQEDAEVYYKLNLDEEVMRYTGDVAFHSIEASAQFIDAYTHYEDYGYGRWTVMLKSSGEVIGWCGLKCHPEEDYVDLGYRFKKEVWGNGYATEAAKGCLQYAWSTLELKEVVGRTSKENVASIRVLEKIGMEFWKEAPCEGIENSVYYKITAPVNV